MLLGVATRSRRLGLPRQCRDRSGRRDKVVTVRCIATTAETCKVLRSSVSVESLPFFASYCTRGTSASSLVWSYTSRSLGTRHLRACPVREVVSIAWDPHPRTPIEGVLRAVGMLESRTLEWRGKRLVIPFLTASLFVAPELLREAWRGTVVRPDYGGYYCGLRVLPHSDEREGETFQQRQGVRRVEETGQ
ncbi:hypothetical protein Taro_013939 [Colocasia esculenta]|uniref:Uncharacterized protein n=1 Tax=Colocasia esculenta TaxID=4460 RepID=A0A843UGX0_COLES|nr:hypothetical protein [Colocasia esculenta]